METSAHETSPRASSAPGVPSLAIASLVLGVLGVLGSFLVIGALLGLVGLVLGAIHLARRSDGRRLGWAGVVLSMVSIVAAAGFVALYSMSVHKLMEAQRMGSSGASSYGEWRGKPAPDFELATLEGERFRLSDLKGRPVVVDFWATWCGPCVMEIPHFIHLQRDLGTNAVTVVGVSSEDRAVLKPFVAAKGINYRIASSQGVDLPLPYSQVTAIPTTFFLDGDGIIQHVHVGYADFDTIKQLALSPEGAPAPAAEAK